MIRLSRGRAVALALRSVEVSWQERPTELMMIEVDGLVKRYGEKTAVNGLTFTVQPGAITGFLGPNGAGKPVTESRRSLALGSISRTVVTCQSMMSLACDRVRP
jgi:ABC-type glutathione transport system ATPase component